MKPVNRNAVAEVACALITLNDQTTTLEVKEALRKKGYWVKQEDVRNLMLDITSNDGLIGYTDNGIHRVYYFKNNPSPRQHRFNGNNICSACGKSEGAIVRFGWNVCAGQMTDVGQSVQNTSNTTIPASSPITGKPHRDHVPATYTVMDIFGAFPRVYYNVTRGQARQLWSKDTGNSYFSARTRKS